MQPLVLQPFILDFFSNGALFFSKTNHFCHPVLYLTFESLAETLKIEIHEVDTIRKGTICMSLSKIAKNDTANSLYAKLPRHMKRSGR